MITPLTQERFEPWSGQHYLLLVLTAIGVVTAAVWGRSHRGTPREIHARRAFALVALSVTIDMQIYWLMPHVRTVRNSWPLQLSDLADYAAVFALWTRGRRTAAFTYYVGLTLTLSAVVTPSLSTPFPDPRWFGFWLRHIFVVWAAVYLVSGLGIRPTWRVCRTTVLAASTPLDLLGQWPWYVLGALAFLMTLWALATTLPWRLLATRTARG